jgi:ABC-type glycerol-3-phosphate transport system permease component
MRRPFLGSAFFIFLLRQFFTPIPMEMEEAARIDWANRLQVFLRIMISLLAPALATIVIFTFLGQYSAEFNLLMAAAVVMLPTVALFFAQRYFIEGITLTRMKG